MASFSKLERSQARTLLVAFLIAAFSRGLVAQQAPSKPKKAPSIEGGLEWINTDQPIALDDLKGKFVILDFWTYCCINCIQTLPDLKQLEHAYPKQLVVIGVHAPKFFGERDTDNIREAVMRHEIEHPVVNDANVVIAKKYGVEGWPSLRVIDPEGNLIASHYGEATFDMLNNFMKQAIPRYRRKGVLDESPIQFHSKNQEVTSAPLRFPGKVLADSKSGRLFIADTGHNRIVVSSLDGTVTDVIGTGDRGHRDGAFEQATFSTPQGMAIHGQVLYLADTENHMIRQLDFETRRVSTLAGTGQQGTTVVLRNSKRPKQQRLASPWDVAIHGEALFIAMAGMHQIWQMTLDGKNLQTFTGSGSEDIVDGPLRPKKVFEDGVAAFAQPTGLALGNGLLYIADSEGSSIRAVELQHRGVARTILGTAQLPKPRRLFTYGDQDGPVAQALLQHPMCVASWEDSLFVADTYNNKIKVIDLKTSQIRTVAGNATPGNTDDPPRFDEPAGLCVAADTLFVADTNNHAIRMIDINESGRVTTLELVGLSSPILTKTGTQRGTK